MPVLRAGGKFRAMMYALLTDRLVCSAFLAILAWAACSDAATFKIPDAASLGLLFLYPVHVLASPAAPGWLAAGGVAALVFAVGLILFARGLWGGGDVKLLTAVALWAGPHGILPALLVMAMAGGVLALLAGAMLYVQRWRAAARNATAVAGMPLPYGVAIACGGSFTAMQLLHS